MTMTMTPAQDQHLQRFAAILHLPMFPLYTGADAAKRQQLEQDRQRRIAEYAQMKADTAANQPQLSTADKVGLQVLGAATGTTFFNIDRGVSALTSFGMAMDTLDSNQKATNMLVIVRWASPPEAQCAPVLVDVLEIRGVVQVYDGAYCLVKPSRDVKIRLGVKHEKKIKKGDRWSKTVRGACGVTVLEKGVGEVALEMVMSGQMAMSTQDYVSVQKRFKKEWVVPSV